MKGASIAAGVLAIAGIIAACSSTPSRPPIDTGGSAVPGTGGGGSAPVDGGSADNDSGSVLATSEDGGTAIEAGSCSSGNCSGCCIPSAPQQCFQGTSSAACGLLGSICLACTTGFSCVNGTCQGVP